MGVIAAIVMVGYAIKLSNTFFGNEIVPYLFVGAVVFTAFTVLWGVLSFASCVIINEQERLMARLVQSRQPDAPSLRAEADGL